MNRYIKYVLPVLLLVAQDVVAQQILTLQEVRQRALEHNMEMRTAENNIQQAQQQRKEAFTNYFPQVSATGSAFHSNKEMLRGKVNTADILPSSLASQIPSDIAAALPSSLEMGLLNEGIVAGVQAVQPVFMGGQIVNGNKLAKVGVEASELQKQTSSNNVELTAEKYYWQVVTLKEKMKTLDAVGAMLKSLEKDVDVAVKAGVTLRNDLLQVQLRQNDIESKRIKLDNGLRLARRVLAQYIGMDGQQVDVADSALTDDKVPEYPFALKADPDKSVGNTPEYKLLQKNVEAKSLERRIETGKLLPSVGIGAGYNYTDMLHTQNNFGMLFATVAVPISDWWGGSHAVKRKRLAEQNARERLADGEQLLKIRMQKNWDDVDDAYKQLLIAHKGIEQSEENLRLNRNFYQAGTVNMSDLLDAQQQYQQQRDSYVDAYATLQTKMTEYRQSVGQ
jgi:outer membrane protein